MQDKRALSQDQIGSQQPERIDVLWGSVFDEILLIVITKEIQNISGDF